MLAAHEMFKNANRVSRAEKALILGFMAGARGTLSVCTSLVLCGEQQRYIRSVKLHCTKTFCVFLLSCFFVFAVVPSCRRSDNGVRHEVRERRKKKGGREKYIGGNLPSHPLPHLPRCFLEQAITVVALTSLAGYVIFLGGFSNLILESFRF